MRLLDEFVSMERKRIERSTYLIEMNEKVERTNELLMTENRNLLTRVDDQLGTMRRLENVS